MDQVIHHKFNFKPVVFSELMRTDLTGLPGSKKDHIKIHFMFLLYVQLSTQFKFLPNVRFKSDNTISVY